MLFLGYNPSHIEGTLEPTLLDPLRALLHLPNFRNFFGLFAPFLPNNITILVGNEASGCYVTPWH